MWVRTVLLLTSSWLVWASQDAPEYAKQQRQALTSHAYQRAVRSPEERWARFTTGINTREGQLLLRTKRGIKDGDGHVITSFRHIPGKALNVATRLVTDISMRDCAVHCIHAQCKAWSHNNATNECRFLKAKSDYVAVPVVQPHSDFFEISLKNLGATIITFLFQGAASHNIDVRPEQIRLISDPLAPENVLTDHLEPLPPPPPTTPTPVTQPPSHPDPPVEVTTPAPPDAPTPVPDLSYHFNFPTQCGVRPTFGLSDFERLLEPSGNRERTRVVGGTPVATGTYPWQAQIEISNERGSGYEHSCGGIVISDDLILTAAHCHTKHENNYQVRVAQNDLQNPDDPDERVLAVESVYRNPGHRPDLQQGQRNDIAMMRLKFRRGEPHGLRFSDYIQPLCLPAQNTTLVIGQQCQISGWGLVDANHPKSADYASRFLRGALIEILDPAICRRAYGNRFDERRWFAAGIVSFGWECGAAGHPGVYTRVSAYLEFVHRTAAFLTDVEVVV
ncbi:Transmembrane protease serine 9 [Amphibalanus amphitrite]|uniref:Transmembrane protease serine 9 n=1 Tax=Amphibalanus amphitrite TaxID=1232801 RepID=A0A6A4WQ00_AMPAM|nr:Transmembrane protease serine 9 [Amphibalanus amphitrite]